MRKRLQTSTLIAGALILSTISIAQKNKNETSAAVEFKNNYLPAIAMGDVETAKKSLISAKKYIDLAENDYSELLKTTPDAPAWPKTLWLKGEIYSSFMMVGMQTMDTSFIKLAGEDAIDVSIAAFKKGYDVSDKFDADIRESAYQKHDMLDVMASLLYKGNMFKEAAEVYETEVKFFDAVGEMDTTSIFNAALCYEKVDDYANAAKNYAQLAKINYKGTTCYILASNAYRNNKQIDEARAIIAEGRKKNPNDRDLLLELVNTNIAAGDAAAAEAALSEAISADPKNKQLYYTIGTIYIDLKQNEKAETSLNKALEIDPDYADALYQLGAHLITWASDTRTAASQLKLNDPKYDKMIVEADAIFNRALVPLEKYISKAPNDKDVLTILYKLYVNLGNTEKASEYKKRADAIK